MHDFENERGASDNPQPPADDGLSLIDREILEFYDDLPVRHGINPEVLPYDILLGLTRYISRNLHPHSVGEFCGKAGDILSEMGEDYGSIAMDAKKRCH